MKATTAVAAQLDSAEEEPAEEKAAEVAAAAEATRLAVGAARLATEVPEVSVLRGNKDGSGGSRGTKDDINSGTIVATTGGSRRQQQLF